MMDRCNNGCQVCFEQGRAFEIERAALEFQLEVGREQGALQVTFTGREPTLHESLPQIVASARDLGYLVIQLVTNGRRLGDPDLARALVAAGLTEVLVPLWGPDAAIHDEMTRVKGSFAQTVRGVRTLLAVAGAEKTRARAVGFTLGTPVTARNVARLAEMVPLAHRLRAVELSFLRQREGAPDQPLPPPDHEVRAALRDALEVAVALRLPVTLVGFAPFDEPALDARRAEALNDDVLAPLLAHAGDRPPPCHQPAEDA
jgi:molybdenum cofactor biosynthesis enzyme MoaA